MNVSTFFNVVFKRRIMLFMIMIMNQMSSFFGYMWFNTIFCEGVVGQFSVHESSVFSFNFSDVLIFFGVDPNNQVLMLMFCMLSLSVIILMFLYFLTLYLMYIYLHYKYKDNLEFNWINNYLPNKYSAKMKSMMLSFIKYWNKSSYIMVMFSLMWMMMFSIASTYFMYQLFINFDKYVELYLSYKNNKN